MENKGEDAPLACTYITVYSLTYSVVNGLAVSKSLSKTAPGGWVPLVRQSGKREVNIDVTVRINKFAAIICFGALRSKQPERRSAAR